MALAIRAVLPSGTQLPTLAVDLSWTGAEVKTALSEHFEKPAYVSALIYKDHDIKDDQTFEGFCSDCSAEVNSIDLSVIVSERVKLADVAQLPGMSAEYKFDHWSGEEIYPDEEAEYREKAAKTECYFLKQKVAAEKPMIKVTMSQEWVTFYDTLKEQNGGREPERKTLRSSSTCLTMKQILDGTRLNDALKHALSDSYDALDRVDFKLKNNMGATAKYQIVDGHSLEPIRLADHETPLYILFTGTVEFQRTEMQIQLNAAYLSDDKYCGVHRPFFM